MSDINLTNRRRWFQDLLKKHDRIAITGGPKSGKTTLSRLAHGRRTVIHTDSFIDRDRSAESWSKASQMTADEANKVTGKLLVEGVAGARALRKGMRVDAVLWLNEPIDELTPGQKTMAKGLLTVFAEWHAKNKHIPVYQAPKPVPFVGDEPEGEFDDA